MSHNHLAEPSKDAALSTFPGEDKAKALRRRSAPLRYPGSKWSLAPLIVEQFGDHYHYVEPYFGSGAVFFTKPPSGHELINDSYGRLKSSPRL